MREIIRTSHGPGCRLEPERGICCTLVVDEQETARRTKMIEQEVDDLFRCPVFKREGIAHKQALIAVVAKLTKIMAADSLRKSL